MDINQLKSIFQLRRSYSTEDVNELLDFAKKSYIYNEISFSDYRTLVYHLEEQGAVAIELFQDHSFSESTILKK